MSARSRQKPMVVISIAITALALSACGGDRKEQRGRFIDSAVEGAEWFSGDRSGLTDADGGFNYRGRESVRFAIGAVDLGQARGDDIITPLDLADTDNIDDPLVLNRARLLLSLDEDQIPSNGIKITAATRAAATQPIFFDQTLNDFGLDPAVIDLANVAQANQPTFAIVSAADARAHLSETLEGIRGDQQPTASAGADVTVQSEETVYLCGEAGDPDGSIVNFNWRQLEPLETTVNLQVPDFDTEPDDEDDEDNNTGPTLCDAENLTRLSVSFVAPTVITPTTLNFEFSAEDDSGLKAYDTVQVTINPL